MKYVGLDLHARRSTLAILEEGEKPQVRNVEGPLRMVLDAVREIQGPFEICFEASNGYGVAYEELAKVAQRVVVGHPGQLSLIFRSKNKHDRRDALKLAQLLRAGWVPSVHVPRRDVRRWRQLIHHRHTLVVQRGGVKAQVRSLLRGLGIEAPKSLWCRKGLAWLGAVVFADPSDALTRDEHVEHVRYLDGAIGRAERRLDEIAAEHPGVALLQTIPGIGPRTAEALVAWIDDPRRFERTKAIGKYFGLVPCEDSSAGKTHLGHITKEGPSVVRALLNQAAWRARSTSAHVRAFYERVQRGDKDRKKIATVATMHYLARVALGMLRTGEAWRHSAE